jgi:uncharacterized protein (TIGR02001 family)
LQEQLEHAPVGAPWRVTRTRLHFLPKQAALHGAVALGFALLAADVSAQVSGSVKLLSDYRFRGVSLSQDKPAAQVTVAYDDPHGWYTGAFASTVRLARSGGDLQAVSFLGYASRLPSGLSWDAGADYSAYAGIRRYNYAEMYVGIASENVSARLYYSRRYFGHGTSAVYGEIDSSRPLFDRVRLLAHLGVLRSGGHAYYGPSDRLLFDARAGVGIALDGFSVELAWVGMSSTDAASPITGVRGRNSAVLTLSRSF